MAVVTNSGGRVISLEWDRPLIAPGVSEEPAAQGPSESLEAVFQQYLDPVYRFMYRQVGNHHDAEDLTSDVFLKASRSLELERAPAAIGSWLFTVSRSVIADHWRRRYRVPPMLDVDEMQIAEVKAEDIGEAGKERSVQLVDQILGRLPERQAELLRLRFLKGFTIAETAAELGITVANAKVIQHRALAAAVKFAEETL